MIILLCISQKFFFAMICQVWNRFMELEKIFKRLQKAGKVLADFSAAAHNELKLGKKTVVRSNLLWIMHPTIPSWVRYPKENANVYLLMKTLVPSTTIVLSTADNRHSFALYDPSERIETDPSSQRRSTKWIAICITTRRRSSSADLIIAGDQLHNQTDMVSSTDTIMVRLDVIYVSR